jgi:hypothetical protein
VNVSEIEAVSRVVAALRRKHPNSENCSIAVLTFYKGQMLQLQKSLPDHLNVNPKTLNAKP